VEQLYDAPEFLQPPSLPPLPRTFRAYNHRDLAALVASYQAKRGCIRPNLDDPSPSFGQTSTSTGPLGPKRACQLAHAAVGWPQMLSVQLRTDHRAQRATTSTVRVFSACCTAQWWKMHNAAYLRCVKGMQTHAQHLKEMPTGGQARSNRTQHYHFIR
jgi:hypothetical protein